MNELLAALEEDRAVVAGEAEREVEPEAEGLVEAVPRKVGRPRKVKARRGKDDPGGIAAEDCERIVQKSPCGWCMDGLHDGCMIETDPWYGKIWLCGCDDSECLSSRGGNGGMVAETVVNDVTETGDTHEHPGDQGVLDSVD